MAATASVLGKRTRSSNSFTPASCPRTTPRTPRTRSARQKIVPEGDEDTIVLCTEPPLKKARITPQRTRTRSAGDVLSPQKVNLVFGASNPKAKAAVVEDAEDSKENNKTVEASESQEAKENEKAVKRPTPKTPRKRKIDTARTPKTPKTPRTPQQKVSVVSTPRKLFGTPAKPGTRTPCKGTPGSVRTTILSTAKALFSRSSTGGKLVGRDEERSKLQGFLQCHVEKLSGGCLYVSGPPGCGKSALLGEILAGFKMDTAIKNATVNCMSLNTPSAIYAALLAEFVDDADADTDELPLDELEALFTTGDSKLHILVLDEIDALASRLEPLFSLSLRPNSNLLLIGIANSLDLTARLLPSLKSHGLKPETLPFLPYTAAQISHILTTRLQTLLTLSEVAEHGEKFVPCVHPAALQLLGRKVASASGDLRKAFDILRRAFELLELEHAPSRGALAENPAAVNSHSPPQPIWTAITAPRITLSHIARASVACLGSTLTSRVASLTNLQRTILCVLVSKAGSAAISMGRLRDEFNRIARNEDIAVLKLGQAEFRGVVEGLEGAGMVEVLTVKDVGATPRKGGRREESVKGRVGRMELVTAVAGGEGKAKEALVGILTA